MCHKISNFMQYLISQDRKKSYQLIFKRYLVSEIDLKKDNKVDLLRNELKILSKSKIRNHKETESSLNWRHRGNSSISVRGLVLSGRWNHNRCVWGHQSQAMAVTQDPFYTNGEGKGKKYPSLSLPCPPSNFCHCPPKILQDIDRIS